MRKICGWALIIATFVIPQFALAAISAREIVEKTYAAEKKATLQGIKFVSVQAGRAPVSSKVRVYRSQGRSRMEFLTGPTAGTIIIESNNSIITISAKQKMPTACLQHKTGDYLSQLFKNYVPKLVGSQSIAGRNCYIIKLEPKFSGNPTSKIWVDKEKYIILRTDWYGLNGRLFSLSRYDSIDFSARPPDSLFTAPIKPESSAVCRSTMNINEVRKAVGFTPLKPKYLPKGYTFDGYYIQTSPCGISFAALKYANGLNTISVFESKCPCAGPGCMADNRGQKRRFGRGARCGPNGCILADRPHARMFQTRVGDITIAVVGDAPTSELVKIAESIK